MYVHIRAYAQENLKNTCYSRKSFLSLSLNNNFTMVKKEIEAVRLLKTYQGINPYLLKLKREVFENGKSSLVEGFVAEYILKNYATTPRIISKTVKIADWYGAKLQQEHSIEFLPEKIHIKAYLGETSNVYHIYAKWRKSMDYIELFVPKKGIINNFLVDDFHNYPVSFDRYNNLLHAKDPNRTVKPIQEEAVKFLLARKKCILANQMGTGKSMALSIGAIEGNFDSVLVICPASLKTNWKNELEWFVPSKDISIIEGFAGKNKAELEAYLGYGQGKSGKSVVELRDEAKVKGKWENNRFVIVNFDILDEFFTTTSARSDEGLKKVAETNPLFNYVYGKKSLIIIDEAHSLSNCKSDRFKLIKNLLGKARPDCIWLSTGTPITNHPENYFNLLALIGDPIANDWNYYAERYCDAKRFPAKGEKEKWTNRYLKSLGELSVTDLNDEQKEGLKDYIRRYAKMITVSKGESNLDELRERTSHIYLRREKTEMGGLPQKHVIKKEYEFTMSQMLEYNKLWEEYEIEKAKENPNKELNKDLIEGAIYRKYCSNQMIPNTERLADEYIAKGQKVVIMCCYDEELYNLRDYYGNRCVIFNGKISLKEKDEAVSRFMNDPSVMVFIGNMAAASVGITLTSSNVMIFNNLHYAPAMNRQAEDRIYRIGQQKECYIYYQIFKGTEYEKIWDTVLGKELGINQVIKKEDEK